MDDSHERHSGVDSRATIRLSTQHQDDEEDDYDLEAMGISDGYSGYRPGMGGMAAMGSSGMTENRLSQASQQYTPAGRRTPPPRPSSTTKPRGLDSFALRHDGGMGPIQRHSTVASTSTYAPSRRSSVSTEMSYVRPESPYRGPTGPSHHYQMYSQEERLARTASVATTATVQVPDRPYTGPGGPTHPYGMYPQNIAEAEMVEDPIVAVPAVPVGFPGARDNYQRRLGPEGEEIAGLIGPDGHTEELPPYTQYPDEAFARKTRSNNVVPVVIPGAGGMGLATRNPEFASQEDLRSLSPQSLRSTPSIISETSIHQFNVAALGESGKPQLKKWQQVARRKLCNVIPIWVVVLLALVFVLFGIILGTVLAVLRPKHNNSADKLQQNNSGHGNVQSIVVTTMTTTYDATPLSTTPAGISAIATGTYALPISAPSVIQNSCLSDTQQSSAWSCQIPEMSYVVTVTPISGSANVLRDNEIDLNISNDTVNNFFAYGAKPPTLTQAQIMNLVTDNDEVARGPAWFFQLPYNKFVVVQQDSLSGAGSLHSKRDKRDDNALSIHDFTRKQVAQPGDNPWFCYWNGTMLEAFIYANQTSSAGRASKTTSSSSSGASPTSSSYSQSSGGSSSGSSGSSNQQPQWLPAYPLLLKLEERRVEGAQSIAPYCVQQHIDSAGNATPLINSTGQAVTIYLNETQSSSVSSLSTKRSFDFSIDSSDNVLASRQESSSDCGCIWLWT